MSPQYPWYGRKVFVVSLFGRHQLFSCIFQRKVTMFYVTSTSLLLQLKHIYSLVLIQEAELKQGQKNMATYRKCSRKQEVLEERGRATTKLFILSTVVSLQDLFNKNVVSLFRINVLYYCYYLTMVYYVGTVIWVQLTDINLM